MLGSHKIMAFAPTLDANKARPFYESVLGLRVMSQDSFAFAVDANGIMLRVTNVPPGFKPQEFRSWVASSQYYFNGVRAH
jgi:hypothetical protein